jgi:hypothetical protein
VLSPLSLLDIPWKSKQHLLSGIQFLFNSNSLPLEKVQQFEIERELLCRNWIPSTFFFKTFSSTNRISPRPTPWKSKHHLSPIKGLLEVEREVLRRNWIPSGLLVQTPANAANI